MSGKSNRAVGRIPRAGVHHAKDDRYRPYDLWFMRYQEFSGEIKRESPEEREEAQSGSANYTSMNIALADLRPLQRRCGYRSRGQQIWTHYVEFWSGVPDDDRPFFGITGSIIINAATTRI